MIARCGRRNYQIKAMDIETHNDDESIAMNRAGMWLGCYIDDESSVTDEMSYFYTIDEFLSRVEEDARPKRNKAKTRQCSNVCVYIFNLSFEWSFILPVMLSRGWTYKSSFDEDDEYCFNTVSTKSVSSVWLVNLKFGKRSGRVMLRDLSKIFGGQLRTVAESFHLETQKGDIDYRLNRLHGHVVTPAEKEYCFKDCKILVEICQIMAQRGDKTFFSVVSMASYAMKKLLKTGYSRSLRPYRAYRRDYPELDKEETEFLRKSVEGGLCYPVPDYQFKILTDKIAHIDAHQMHPSSAYLNAFPYGKGEYFTGNPPPDKISCVRCLITYDDVKLWSNIRLIGLPFVTDKEITIWTPELRIMRECYVNFKVKFIDGYAYNKKRLPWRKFYEDNYRLRLKAKAEGDAFNVLYYKLLNNSSYGKMLENPHNKEFENYIRDDGIIDSIVHDVETELPNAKFTYIPVGAMIPAYSRISLIETALKIGEENCTYFDTDSIFFKWNKDTEKEWSKINQRDFLGGWDMVEFIQKAQFTASKRYKFESDKGKTEVKAGGINFHNYIVEKLKERGIEDPSEDDVNAYDMNFEEVNIVSSKWKVQRAYRCPGGTLIKFQDKEMGVVEKYREIYEKNVESLTD